MDETAVERFHQSADYLNTCYEAWMGVLDNYDRLLRTFRHLTPELNNEIVGILRDFKTEIEKRRQKLNYLYDENMKCLRSGCNLQETQPLAIQTAFQCQKLLLMAWPVTISATQAQPDSGSVPLNNHVEDGKYLERKSRDHFAIPKMIRENYGALEKLHKNIVRDIYNVPRFMVGFVQFLRMPTKFSLNSGKTVQFKDQETQTDQNQPINPKPGGFIDKENESKFDSSSITNAVNKSDESLNVSHILMSFGNSPTNVGEVTDRNKVDVPKIESSNHQQHRKMEKIVNSLTDKIYVEILELLLEREAKLNDFFQEKIQSGFSHEETVTTDVELPQNFTKAEQSADQSVRQPSTDRTEVKKLAANSREEILSRDRYCIDFLMATIIDEYGESRTVSVKKLYTYLKKHSDYTAVVGKLSDFPNFLATYPQFFHVSSDGSLVKLVKNTNGNWRSSRRERKEPNEMDCVDFLTRKIKLKYGESTQVALVNIYGHLSKHPEHRVFTGTLKDLPGFLAQYPSRFQLSPCRTKVSLLPNMGSNPLDAISCMKNITDEEAASSTPLPPSEL